MSSGAHAYSETASATAREQLIVEHLWLVRHVACRLTARLPAGVDTENLESAGMLGLVEAAGRFQPSQGAAFRTFAAIRIRGAILDELRRNCPLPQEMLQQVNQVQQAKEQLPPPVLLEDLMRATGYSQAQVLDALAAMPFIRMNSLDASGAGEHVPAAELPEDIVQRDDCKQVLAEAISALPERERLIITLYYNQELRLKEIGEVLQLSESRVSRLLTAARFQLREFVRARLE